MRRLFRTSLAIALAALAPAAVAAAADGWSRPQAPVRLHGDSYYVGSAGLSSVLIDSGDGLILLDGTLPKNAPMIEANLRTLGFAPANVRYILNSHAHFDHAGGIAALAKDSGATVVASPSGARALRAGRAADDDPQAADADGGFPAVTTPIREIADGETLRVGRVAITAHFTPGHTPGSTTWTWRSCEKQRCLDLVFGDSINAISSPGFHFLADASHGDLTPRIRRSIATLAALPCDILVPVHPDSTGLDRTLARVERGEAGPDAFVDKHACRDYAAKFTQVLDRRIAEEKAAAAAAR